VDSTKLILHPDVQSAVSGDPTRRARVCAALDVSRGEQTRLADDVPSLLRQEPGPGDLARPTGHWSTDQRQTLIHPRHKTLLRPFLGRLASRLTPSEISVWSLCRLFSITIIMIIE